MGFEWQFGTESRTGRAPANGKGGVESIDGAENVSRRPSGRLRKIVPARDEHTDGSACGSTSAKHG